MKKAPAKLKGLPMVTGDVSEELGVVVTKEFLIRKLKIKPLLSTKTSAYWDDINLIKQRMGEYFTKASQL